MKVLKHLLPVSVLVWSVKWERSGLMRSLAKSVILMFVCLHLQESASFKRLSHDQRQVYSHSTSPDRTTLPAQHFRSSGLLCRWSDSLELATGQSPWPGGIFTIPNRFGIPAFTSNSFRQSLKTENESVSWLPPSTHSAVEMLHNSALYKSIIDIDIEITVSELAANWHELIVP